MIRCSSYKEQKHPNSKSSSLEDPGRHDWNCVERDQRVWPLSRQLVNVPKMSVVDPNLLLEEDEEGSQAMSISLGNDISTL